MLHDLDVERPQRERRSQPPAAGGDLPDEACKLLTFVDSRQDASLQAGYFNDFVQVSMLRGALHQAADQAGTQGLHETVAAAVVDQLGLRFGEYADLTRRRRITLPNLEQTGCCASTTPTSTGSPADPLEHRRQLMAVLLDELRRSLAVDVEVLTPPGFERVQRLCAQYLIERWSRAPHMQCGWPAHLGRHWIQGAPSMASRPTWVFWRSPTQEVAASRKTSLALSGDKRWHGKPWQCQS